MLAEDLYLGYDGGRWELIGVVIVYKDVKWWHVVVFCRMFCIVRYTRFQMLRGLTRVCVGKSAGKQALSKY